jgi:dihydroxy-acid dehydratase
VLCCAVIEDGDVVEISVDSKTIDLLVDEAEVARRLEAWVAPAEKYEHGVMHKYSRLVGNASEGATLGR